MMMLLFKDEVLKYVKNKLENDWIIITGNIEVFKYIENTVYPPGTPKNKNFEIIYGGTPLSTIVLARKNIDLKQHLFKNSNMTKEEFENLLILECYNKLSKKDGKIPFLMRMFYFKPNKKEESIKNILEEIADNLNNYR